MHAKAIIYAIKDNQLTKIGTYSKEVALRIVRNDSTYVAINTEDGTVLQPHVVTIFNARGFVAQVERFYNHEDAMHYYHSMLLKGYDVAIRRI